MVPESRSIDRKLSRNFKFSQILGFMFNRTEFCKILVTCYNSMIKAIYHLIRDQMGNLSFNYQIARIKIERVTNKNQNFQTTMNTCS